MKHFWIAFIMIWVLIALAGHGILTVWSRQIKVGQYKAETDRREFIMNICDPYEFQKGMIKIYFFGEEEVDCGKIQKQYDPDKKIDQTKLL